MPLIHKSIINAEYDTLLFVASVLQEDASCSQLDKSYVNKFRISVINFE